MVEESFSNGILVCKKFSLRHREGDNKKRIKKKENHVEFMRQNI